MSIADPFTAPNAWTSAVIGGQTTPGFVEVTDAHRPFGWDVKGGKGADGATVTHTGKQLAEPKLKIKLWTSEHFAAWDAFVPLLKYEPTKGKPVLALDIYHPALAAIDCNSVVVKKLGAPTHKGGGLFEVDIELLEYRPPPPKKAVATPSQSTGDGADDANGNRQDPQVVALQKQVAALLPKVQQAYAP